MADFFSKLTKGISSESSIAQGGEGFRLVDPSGGATQQAQNFNSKMVEDIVKQGFQGTQTDQLAASNSPAIQPVAPPAPGANPYGVQRLPWIFATFADLTNSGQEQLKSPTGLPEDAIIWHANPKSVEWNISQRGTEAKTKAGTVLHIWRDKTRNTDFDDPKITITFQSGNIMPGFANGVDAQGMSTLNKPDQPVAPGLNDFYKFLQLVDASKIKSGQANLIHILYRSRIFPSMVMSGFFEPQSVVRFSDSSDNPFQVNSWSATFTIYKTVPALNEWRKLRDQFVAEFNNGTDPFNRNNLANIGTFGGPPSGIRFGNGGRDPSSQA